MASRSNDSRAFPCEIAAHYKDDKFCAARLERVFAQCFSKRWQTRLQGGSDEPLYQPAACISDYHTLGYKEDYFASALHETAHWCIAGERRRKLTDFGYWYAPDGRDAKQQEAFEGVEVKPQALEWLFSLACGYPFRVSLDNLTNVDGANDVSGFQQRVRAQAQHWQSAQLPSRGQMFFEALAKEFATSLNFRTLDLMNASMAS